jgi:hypothetical protein
MSITLELEEPCHYYNVENDQQCQHGFLYDLKSKEPARAHPRGSQLTCRRCRGTGMVPNALGQQILDFIERHR